MQLHYDWPDGILESIDWEAHHQATHSQTDSGTHYVKLCHDILPTGSIVCKYGHNLPDYCSLCRSPKEDFHHILRCPHPTRLKWRLTMLTTLMKACHALRTDPTLTSILLDGITGWLHNIPVALAENSTEFHSLILEQTSIGWAHFFQGKISSC